MRVQRLFNTKGLNSILSFGFTSALFQANYEPQAPAAVSSSKMEQVQGQVNEVKVILKDNIDKVLERGDRLDDLMDKTEDLQATVSIGVLTKAVYFKVTAF